MKGPAQDSTGPHGALLPRSRTPIFSEVAELARLEPLQHQLEGLGANSGGPEKGWSMAAMVNSTSAITPASDPTISACALVFSKPKRCEAHHHNPPNNQNHPKDDWQTLIGHDQAHPPGVRQPLDLVEPFCVEPVQPPCEARPLGGLPGCRR